MNRGSKIWPWVDKKDGSRLYIDPRQPRLFEIFEAAYSEWKVHIGMPDCTRSIYDQLENKEEAVSKTENLILRIEAKRRES